MLEANKKKVFGWNYKPPNSWQKQDGNKNGGNGSQGNQSKMAYVLNAAKEARQTQETTVFIDSGASHHYTGDVDRLTNYSENVPSHKLSGISSQLTTQGCGNLTIPTLYNGQPREVTFTQVYYVPGMQGTLISVGQLKKKGVTVDFKLLNLSRTNEVLTDFVELENCMFAFKEVEHVAYQSAKKESLLDWHKKLGHVHFARVKEVLNREGISYEPSPEECETCMLTKATRKPFKSSATITSKPLELVHSDVAFFSEKLLSGKLVMSLLLMILQTTQQFTFLRASLKSLKHSSITKLLLRNSLDTA
jgi:hypothetical protein